MLRFFACRDFRLCYSGTRDFDRSGRQCRKAGFHGGWADAICWIKSLSGIILAGFVLSVTIILGMYQEVEHAVRVHREKV